MENQYFSQYKVKALCRDFITFLASVKRSDNTFQDVQVAVPVSLVQTITEIPGGVRIGTVEGRYIHQYDVPKAHIKMVAEAIRQAQIFEYRKKDEWKKGGLKDGNVQYYASGKDAFLPSHHC